MNMGGAVYCWECDPDAPIMALKGDMEIGRPLDLFSAKHTKTTKHCTVVRITNLDAERRTPKPVPPRRGTLHIE